MTEFLSSSAVWGVVLTVGAFALGTFINRKTGKAWCNSLLLGTVTAIMLLTALDVPYPEYKDSASPLSYLLLSATVSLAIPLYEKWELLKENFIAIAAGVLSRVVVSLGGIAALAWLLKLDGHRR